MPSPTKNLVSFILDLPSGAVVVVVHSASAPSAEEWSKFLTDSDRALSNAQPHAGRGVVWTDGYAPDAKKRAEFAAVVDKYRPRALSSVFTNSSVVRGVVTALNWVIDGPRAFSPQQVRAAFEHVRIPAAEHEQALLAIQAQLVGMNIQVFDDTLRAFRAGRS